MEQKPLYYIDKHYHFHEFKYYGPTEYNSQHFMNIYFNEEDFKHHRAFRRYVSKSILFESPLIAIQAAFKRIDKHVLSLTTKHYKLMDARKHLERLHLEFSRSRMEG
jgi:hypothetical protein